MKARRAPARQRRRIAARRELFLALETRFGDAASDAALSSRVPEVRRRGWLTPDDVEAVCRWKSPRALPLVRANAEEEVREATRWALATPVERLRIESLLLLRGVSWPMGSVVLHFFHEEPYPVIDVRALWSLGLDARGAYTFPLWKRYVDECRALAAALSLSMRTVDRALWQFAKERDP